jgi:hypothetical protein
VLAVGWLLIAPALDLVPEPDHDAERLAVRWPLQLMVGAGLVFTSLTFVRVWAIALVAAGIAIGLPALLRIVPRGTFRARRGVPATALAAFLLSTGFLAMDAFLTLMLTGVRGISLAQASLAITAATLTWAAGSAWQSGRAGRIALPRLVTIGTIAVLAGQLTVACALFASVPVWLAYVGWALAGAGMGVAFPTIPLATMRIAGVGEEAGLLSSVLLMDMLGVATGAGLGGAAVAVAEAMDASLAAGIGASFAIGTIALVALALIARRMTPER